MHSRSSLALSLAVMVASGAGTLAALDWPLKAKLFPMVIGIPLFFLAAAEVAWILLSKTPEEKTAQAEISPAIARRRSLLGAGWILGLLASVVLLGFPIAVPLFVFLYLKLQGREGWVISIAIALGTWGLFYGLFDRLLHLPFPAGWLLSWVGFFS
ncbi:MAG TPA: tripartite tricarboxylate transporter TctB family protein [Burkholderiales bacterium]